MGQIMKKFLTSGSASNVYEDNYPDFGGVIIKESKNDGGAKYIEKQIVGYGVIRELLDSGRNIGVNLPMLISIDKEKGQIVEKRISGADLTFEIYEKLSNAQKNALAEKMAIFLNAMHRLRPAKPAQKSIKAIYDSNRNVPNSAQEFIECFEHKISPAFEDVIRGAENYLLKSDIADEVHVMTHRDLRDQNIMYDDKTGQISVIDFERAMVSNIYCDLVPVAPASIISWDFTSKIIDFYNKISENKLNKEKVRNALIYGIMHEYARCFKLFWEKDFANMGKDERNKDMERRAKNIECRLESLSLMEGKKTLLNAAAKRIQDSAAVEIYAGNQSQKG
jgi:tRNA A-37 threonylcarbamoyl transferase component Bud32